MVSLRYVIRVLSDVYDRAFFVKIVKPLAVFAKKPPFDRALGIPFFRAYLIFLGNTHFTSLQSFAFTYITARLNVRPLLRWLVTIVIVSQKNNLWGKSFITLTGRRTLVVPLFKVDAYFGFLRPDLSLGG